MSIVYEDQFPKVDTTIHATRQEIVCSSFRKQTQNRSLFLVSDMLLNDPLVFP